jgi:hypothetical protein
LLWGDIHSKTPPTTTQIDHGWKGDLTQKNYQEQTARRKRNNNIGSNSDQPGPIAKVLQVF